jgi:hypothetical protein
MKAFRFVRVLFLVLFIIHQNAFSQTSSSFNRSPRTDLRTPDAVNPQERFFPFQEAQSIPFPNHPASSSQASLEWVDDIGGSSFTVTISGNLVFVKESPRVIILDATDRRVPEFLSCFRLPVHRLGSNIYHMVADGQTLYAAALRSGIFILDISDPRNPVQIRCLKDTVHFLKKLGVKGNVVFAADPYSGLHVIDVSNPAQPAEITVLGTKVQGVSVEGSLVYYMDLTTLHVLDITAPYNPLEKASYEITDLLTVYDKGMSTVGFKQRVFILVYS